MERAEAVTGPDLWPSFEPTQVPTHKEESATSASEALSWNSSGSTFLDLQWWKSSRITGSDADSAEPHRRSENVVSIEPELEQARLSEDRTVLIRRHPELMLEQSEASREASARLRILEERIVALTPIRSDRELAHVNSFLDSIQRLSRHLD